MVYMGVQSFQASFSTISILCCGGQVYQDNDKYCSILVATISDWYSTVHTHTQWYFFNFVHLFLLFFACKM